MSTSSRQAAIISYPNASSLPSSRQAAISFDCQTAFQPEADGSYWRSAVVEGRLTFVKVYKGKVQAEAAARLKKEAEERQKEEERKKKKAEEERKEAEERKKKEVLLSWMPRV